MLSCPGSGKHDALQHLVLDPPNGVSFLKMGYALMLSQHVIKHLVLRLLNVVIDILNPLVVVAELLDLNSKGMLRDAVDSSAHLVNVLISRRKQWSQSGM